jgi:hypothetical protein
MHTRRPMPAPSQRLLTPSEEAAMAAGGAYTVSGGVWNQGTALCVIPWASGTDQREPPPDPGGSLLLLPPCHVPITVLGGGVAH